MPIGAEMPQRIQLKRIKGWRLPPNTVVVDRRTKWGNPFFLGSLGSSDGELSMSDVLAKYRAHVDKGYLRIAMFHELRGKNLACWCALPKPGQPDLCHAAILLELANA